MSSVLRAFIRESLQQEAIGQIRFIRPSDERTKYQTTDTDTSKAMGDAFSKISDTWLGRALRRTFGSFGVFNPMRAAAGVIPSLVKSTFKNPRKAIAAAGVLGAGSYLANLIAPDAVENASNTVKSWLGLTGSDDDAVQEKFADDLAKFVGQLSSIITPNNIDNEFIQKQDAFNQKTLKNYFDDKVNKIGNSSDFDDFFGNFNDISSIKDDIENIINNYTSQEEQAFLKKVAYNMLLYYTASAALPNAYVLSVAPFQTKLSDQQQKEVTSYIDIMINSINSKQTFKGAKGFCEELGIAQQ
jgi:hypothetical protein